MAENTGGIFTTVGVSIDRLRELGQVGKQLKGQLGGLGKELSTVGTKLQDIGKMRYPRGTVLDQFGQPIVSKIQATSTAVTGLGSRLGMLGTRLKSAGAGLAAFGTTFGRILGRAAIWFAAFKLIMGTIRGIGDTIKDLKDLQMESIFMEPAIAAEDLTNILQTVSPLVRKWGLDVITGLRGVQQISRALSDMYEMDLPTALALTDVAMKVTVATGQNLNETISNMVGYVRLLKIESVGDIDKFMSTLYAAAYLTNEALTDAGKSVSKASLAMDTLTDAVQRMLPSMVRFGLTQADIAAIASVFITNLDEAGQGIGAYSAKLFEAVKNNKDLVETYRDVGVELERGPLLIAKMVSGWQKMNDVQKDAVSSALSIGIGVHITATFLEGLLQIQERSNWVQENTNLLNVKAISIMGTLQKRQDKLKTSMQALSLSVSGTFMPAMSATVSFLNKMVQGISMFGVALGTQVEETMRSAPLILQYIRYLYSGQTRLAEQAAAQMDALREATDKSLNEGAESIYGINEELVRNYAQTQLKLKAIFKAAQRGEGATAGGELLLERTKDIMKEWTREVKIATYALGPYASKVSVAYAKLAQLKEQLQALEDVRLKMIEQKAGTSQLLEQNEAIAKTTFQMEQQGKIIRDVNNELTIGHKYRMMEIAGLNETTIIQEKLRDLEREKIALREKGLNVSGKQLEIDQLHLQQQEETNREWAAISGRIEGVVSSGIKGLIRGTKEWKDVLADIGGTILDIIIEKLVHALFTGQDLGSVFGNIFGAIGGVSGGAGAITSYTTTGMGSIAKAGVGLYHKGGVIKDLIGGLPKFAVGGEVPIMAKPGEFVVQNGPSQTHRGILEAINAGAELGGKTENITYQIYAADARSFTQLLYQNKGAVHGIVREAQRYSMPGFRNRSD